MRILIEEYRYLAQDVKEILQGIDALETVEAMHTMNPCLPLHKMYWNSEMDSELTKNPYKLTHFIQINPITSPPCCGNAN